MKVFTEKQKFKQKWLFIVIGACVVFMIIPLVLNSEDLSNNLAAKFSFLISFFLVITAIFCIRIMTLHTRIDEKGIHYRFTPFHRKRYVILWNDVSNVYIRKYNAMTEYGGWGFRGTIFKSGGKAFNVLGNKGIQIVLKNGKKILIGTQKEVEAERILNDYKSKYLKLE